MPIPTRPRFATSDPEFDIIQTDDGSLTLQHTATGNTFHSGCGAVAECLVVYAENSGIGERLRCGEPSSVLEIGFGSGLSFLTTASLAFRSSTPLDYLAIDHRPLSKSLMKQVLEGSRSISPLVPELIIELLEKWPTELEEFTTLPNRNYSLDIALPENIRLRILIDEVESACLRLTETFDAIYFDPFDPASNRELWSSEVFNEMQRLLKPGGRLVSYCVKSEIRRRLSASGFLVTKSAGPPGGKREVLVATKAL